LSVPWACQDSDALRFDQARDADPPAALDLEVAEGEATRPDGPGHTTLPVGSSA